MKWLVLFLALLSGSLAAPKDLSCKMFIFPVLSNTAYVRLTPSIEKILFNTTTCLRFYSDDTKQQALFSLTTPSVLNALYVYYSSTGLYHVFVGGQTATFSALSYNRNQWNSICVTWDSSTGLTQLWVNGVASPKKSLLPGGSIAGIPIIVLGQHQESYGGKFNNADAFVGHITDVHMWDYTLSASNIQRYSNNIAFIQGNFLNWRALEYNINGNVVVDQNIYYKDKKDCM